MTIDLKWDTGVSSTSFKYFLGLAMGNGKAHYIGDGDVEDYYIWLELDGIILACTISILDDINEADFETNFKPLLNLTIGETNVNIIREIPQTVGNNYQFRSIDVEIGSGVKWYDTIFSFPIPIAVFGGLFAQSPSNEGDIVEIIPLNSLLIGVALNVLSIGTKQVVLSEGIAKYISVGAYLKVSDTIKEEDIGMVIAKDGNAVIVSGGVTKEFPIGALIYMSIKLTPHIRLGSSGVLALGGKPGSFLFPANTPMVVRYYNTNGIAKVFSFIFQYFY